jgi:hypothetical protein
MRIIGDVRAFCTIYFLDNGFQSFKMNNYRKNEWHSHNPNLSLGFKRDRTWGSYYFMFPYSMGLKPLLIIGRGNASNV